MSFFSDLFEGNFSNLGTDITHAPESLINNPTQLAETLGVVGLGVGGVLGLGALAGDAGLFGAGTAAAADVGGTAAADLGATAATDLGATAATDVGAAAAGAAPAGADALSFAPTADALASPVDVVGTPDAPVLTGDTAASTASLPASSPSAIPGIDPLSETPATAGAGAGTSAGGATSTLGSIMSSPYTKLAAGLAPLGIALGMGGQGLPPQIGAAQANAAALAGQGSALNPSQTASLQQMRQDAVNAARQALFNQGVQNPEADTRWAQMTSNIDSQVTAAAQTMIQQNIQNSLAGDQQLIQIAQLQMQSDQNFANNLLNATKALGTAVGGGNTITLKAA